MGSDLFYCNPVEINLPFKEFCRLLGYAENYQLRGFSIVGPDKLDAFYSKYDDLYAVLIQLQQGHVVYEKPVEDLIGRTAPKFEDGAVQLDKTDVEIILSNGELSDHVKMQWKLIGLGLKCGSKVWIPANDQKKIRDQYQFEGFETNFAAGLDTQTRYVENIDVVWKEEFRIDAAFEIENSTAIYFGLLRFADLALVAPNTIYPFFIVAPQEKRNRLIEQLKRPTSKHLHLDRKVRYLSYEAVNEIDDFARNVESGLNVRTFITGKADYSS